MVVEGVSCTPHDSLPSRSRNPNVDSGSKIDVHTVLKLIELAMTARYTSSGASSGVGTSPTCSDLRGSLSSEAMPSHMSCSLRSTWAARYDSGIGKRGDLVAGRSGLDRLEDLLHGAGGYPSVASARNGGPLASTVTHAEGRRVGQHTARMRAGELMTTENGADRNRTSGDTDVVEIDGVTEIDGVIEHDQPSRGYHVEILLIAFASLLLEVAYTRVISFKLFYYYTYLVIGLALLGIGSGGVIMAVSGRLKRARTDSIVMFGSLLGAVSVAIGYLIVARIGIATLHIWEYGTRASFSSLGRLLVICLTLFSSFVAVGVIFAALFGRRSEGIGKLYFADLLGAGLACLAAVYLISSIGPPRMVILGGVILAVVAVWVGWQRRSRFVWVSGAVAVVLAIGVGIEHDPARRTGRRRQGEFRPGVGHTPGARSSGSTWSTSATPPDRIAPRKLLLHDGTLGSIIQRWDGRTESLTDFKFDEDPRSFPFDVLGRPADNVMIIGAAGGHEILASLYYKATHTDAIELNPATYKLLTEDYADYTGHVTEKPGVNYVNGDGRSYLANQDKKYNLIWYPAPDSYSATNASTAGAFVLSESYLYTTGAIKDSLDHLSPDGIVAAQFGEIDFSHKPNRTLRYVNTAREALTEMGIQDPSSHILVSTSSGLLVDRARQEDPVHQRGDRAVHQCGGPGARHEDPIHTERPSRPEDRRCAGAHRIQARGNAEGLSVRRVAHR